MASIDTPDAHTAVVHLIHPYAPFVTRFFAAIQEGPIAVMPAHLIGNLKELNDERYSAHGGDRNSLRVQFKAEPSVEVTTQTW